MFTSNSKQVSHSLGQTRTKIKQYVITTSVLNSLYSITVTNSAGTSITLGHTNKYFANQCYRNLMTILQRDTPQLRDITALSYVKPRISEPQLEQISFLP